MIRQSVVNAQINRLMVLRLRPESLEEIEHAYFEAARGDDHAHRITSWILRHLQYWPTPRDVFDAAADTLREEDLPKRNRNCPACDGTGWEHVWQLVSFHKTPNGGVYKSLDVVTDPAAVAELQKRIDGKDQMLYSCVKACLKCMPVEAKPQEDMPVKKPERKSRGLSKITAKDSPGLLD